jgi:hypothetical protein
MKNIKQFIFFALLTPSVLVAQKVPDQSQDVVKNFDARLIESEKITVNPVLPAVDTTTKAQSYNVPNVVLNVDYTPPKMRPIGMPQQKLPPQYHGYAKLGYGFPNSPYGEGAYRYGDASKFLIGAKVKHHSAADNSYENRRFSTTDGEVNGTFYAQAGLAVDARVGFNNNTRQFYGYDHERFLDRYSRNDTKQFFNTLSAGAKAYNSARTVADINYGLGLNFWNLKDNFGNGETDFVIKGEGTKWFSEKHPLSVVIKADFTTLRPREGKTQNLNNIHLIPSFTFKGDAFSVRVGANLVSFKDVFYPLPDIEASLNIAGTQFAAFAGWKGDFVKNSYRNLTAYNPFINPDSVALFQIKNTIKTEYYGGIKGSLSILDYSIQAGYSDNKNLALFLADSTDKFRRFDVLYDTVGITNIRGAVILRAAKDLEITGTVSQNIYTAKKEKAAWGLPSTDVNVTAKYSLAQKGNQKAVAKASLFVQNGVPFKTKAGEIQRLQPLIDVNIGGEYWFSQNIGAFLDLNNVLNLKRERWQYYPMMGLNVLGGITARF